MRIANTVKRFFKEFGKAAKPGKWAIDGRGTLRHRNGWCPIAFCASRRGHNYSYGHNSVKIPARRLGLTISQAAYIANAADYVYGSIMTVRTFQYRKLLLRAAGIESAK